MDNPSRNMENSGAECDLNYGDLTPRGFQRTRMLGLWPRDCSCEVLAKNLTAFYPCLKCLLEAKVNTQ